MTIYIVNILLIGLYSFIYNFEKKENKTKMFLIGLSILQLILLQSLKNINLGSDMPYYWKYFYEQLYLSFQELNFSRFEIGFKIITKLITMITLNKQIYLFIISCISTIPVGIIAYKDSKMPFLTILLYLSFGFYNFNFSGLRQAIAFGIVLFSYKYITGNNIIKYVITILIATIFHNSAIVFLPAYLVKDLTLTKVKLGIIILIDMVIFIFKNQIFNVVNKVFYDNYTITETNSYLWMLMCILILIVCIAFYKRVIRDRDSAKSIYVYSLIGASLMLFAPIANNVLRVANYYFIFIILLIPEVLEVIKNDENKYLINFLVVIVTISLYIYLLKVDSYNIVPYKFFWQ